MGFDARLSAMDAKIDCAFTSTNRALDPVAVFDADLDGRHELLYEHTEGGGYWMSSETEALSPVFCDSSSRTGCTVAGSEAERV